MFFVIEAIDAYRSGSTSSSGNSRGQNIRRPCMRLSARRHDPPPLIDDEPTADMTGDLKHADACDRSTPLRQRPAKPREEGTAHHRGAHHRGRRRFTANAGIVFMDAGGYPSASGHAVQRHVLHDDRLRAAPRARSIRPNASECSIFDTPRRSVKRPRTSPREVHADAPFGRLGGGHQRAARSLTHPPLPVLVGRRICEWISRLEGGILRTFAWTLRRKARLSCPKSILQDTPQCTLELRRLGAVASAHRRMPPIARCTRRTTPTLDQPRVAGVTLHRTRARSAEAHRSVIKVIVRGWFNVDLRTPSGTGTRLR